MSDTQNYSTAETEILLAWLDKAERAAVSTMASALRAAGIGRVVVEAIADARTEAEYAAGVPFGGYPLRQTVRPSVLVED
jgi:hypothetical protein